MATVITMPKLGMNMEEGTLTKWFVEEGGAVVRGEPLFELETDKNVLTINATQDGILLKITAECDEPYPCGTPIAVVGEEGEDSSGLL